MTSTRIHPRLVWSPGLLRPYPSKKTGNHALLLRLCEPAVERGRRTVVPSFCETFLTFSLTCNLRVWIEPKCYHSLRGTVTGILLCSGQFFAKIIA